MRPTRVLTSFENSSHDHCVDLFVRTDGTFGFEEFRRDPEDGSGWFSLRRYSQLVFDSERAALAAAKASVVWMREDAA